MLGNRGSGKDARVEHRGTHSAWLMKEDGDIAAARWFQPCCRQYFTIDFDSRVIFYSHSEQDKYSSAPIPFKEVLWASLAEADPPTPTLKPRPTVFVVETCQRRIRLACESSADAKLWVDALNAARLIGQQAETSGRVGLFRASWGVSKGGASSVASVSTADGSTSSCSSRSGASRYGAVPSSAGSGGSRCISRQAFPPSPASADLVGDRCFLESVEASPRVATSPVCSRGGVLGDLEAADSDILDVLIKELQDDVDVDTPNGSMSGHLSLSDSFQRPACASMCSSSPAAHGAQHHAIDLDVLDVLLHSLDDKLSVQECCSVPPSIQTGRKDRWAAPGGLLHQPPLSARLAP